MDRTVDILKRIAKEDYNVKIIVNARDFGHTRSPPYGLMQASGDAVILLVADLQDPPSLIPEFIRKWEQGFKIVIGVKHKSRENPLIYFLRQMYYNLLTRLSETQLTSQFAAYGLFDKSFIEIIKKFEDPYPFFRGYIAEIGFKRAIIKYTQLKRKRGKSNNNWYTLYDLAILGIISHSKIPLRITIFIGFIFSVLSILAAFGYFIMKLLFWQEFTIGIAPLVIGLFFFSSLQLFFLGVIGEYIGFIYTQVRKRPLVIEKERINFDKKIGKKAK